MNLVSVIRHGRPASSWGDADQDPGLDPAGRAQAEAVAAQFLALPAEERPTRVVSSPLRRCRETAEPLAEALDVDIIIDPRVGEIPTPVGMSAADRPTWLRRAFGGQWQAVEGDLDYRAWAQSVEVALTDYPGAAVFSHFVALNAAVAIATGREEVAVFRPDHCSITRFEVQAGHLRLETLGRESDSQVL
ncbi:MULTISPECIES: histidine phosphatase family protein [unclassified Caulobacter]|uniref:histidine phosphatase family protein n=1 Tax=unclassified Caulobacter TaxID=2648921 RepID=UPI000D33A8AF|nr:MULTISPECIES: histidine phosphatase family protein [unclassified Caulobacter]PTS91634.1 histidine phosphatase family protein [Caulobacter sp. HMWF009]PTT09950.1 histidine phosphatase family protein [Caulobacter sp. HMWF025]